MGDSGDMAAISNVGKAHDFHGARGAWGPGGGRGAPTGWHPAPTRDGEHPPLANARASVRMAAKAIRVPVLCPIATVPGCQVAWERPPPKNSRASPAMIIKPTDPENR